MHFLQRMSRMGRGIVCGAGIMLGAAASVSADDAPSYDELAKELKALRAEVAEIRKERSTEWESQRRADEMKVLVEEALADAETRTAGQATAGFGHNGKNFVLSSEDGSIDLRIRGQIQARYIANFRNAAAEDDAETGFQLRRTKLKFDGHVANPNLKYVVDMDFSRSNSLAGRNMMYVEYKFDDALTVGGGHVKGPLLREELVSSSKQLAVERSLLNEMFTLDHVEGAYVKGNVNEDAKYIVMIHDGADSGVPATDFARDNTDIGITGRIDLRLAGDWKQASDFTSWEGEDLAVFVGAAIDATFPETGEGNTADAQPLTWTVDASLENNGLNTYVAFIGDSPQNSAQEEVYALMVQGGYNISNTIEPFVRWEHMFGDEANTGFNNKRLDWDLLTFGVNYYFKKHNAKLTIDGVWALNELESGSSGLGLLGDTTDARDQLVMRAQFQLLF